jgi:hypothetical protein
MSDINVEMRETANYAISIAKERYGLVLDYSEESLSILDGILEKIYWGFSGHGTNEGNGGLVYNTAIIWGSYLGEYMRLKWGGTWIYRGTEQCISITSLEFSPIKYIYQRITTHPDYRVKSFIQETKNGIYASVIHPPKPTQASIIRPPKPTQVIDSVRQAAQQKPSKVEKKPIIVDKRVIYITGGVLGVLIILTACIAGYAIISSGGLPAFGLFANETATNTVTPKPIIQASPTLTDTATAIPTATELPTYTPKPTETRRPTYTPSLTYTVTPSTTPTDTYVPTSTRTLRPTPTPTRRPTNTPVPPTNPPPATATEPPPPPPPTIQSCGVNPSTITPGETNSLTFTVRFSAPGYGMAVAGFDPGWPGQNGCSAADDDGDGVASCSGSSGLVPPGSSVSVQIQTPLGDCSVSYHTP